MSYRIITTTKTGQELFLGADMTLLDYWRWAHSDIASNSERGKLAEFIVKCAVHAPSTHRTEWDAVDVVTKDGIRIEVKSSAYLQTWSCEKLSKIQFDIAPKKSWDGDTNQYYSDIGRHSDVYVFCLFTAQDSTLANPLDLKQWDFYILNTNVLNTKVPKQKTIGLSALLKLGAKKVSYSEIHSAILSNNQKL